MKQLNLFLPDLPKEYHDFYLVHKRCKHCRADLRHELHAYNHWKKYHYRVKTSSVKVQRVRYFIWIKEQQKWIESTMFQSIAATLQGRPVACSKA